MLEVSNIDLPSITVASEKRWIIDKYVIFELLISHRLGNANFHSLILFHEIKTVRIKSSFAKLIFIALGKGKSESESESIEVTSGMSKDEGERRKKKGKKLVKHKDKKRDRNGRGIHSEMLSLYNTYTMT